MKLSSYFCLILGIIGPTIRCRQEMSAHQGQMGQRLILNMHLVSCLSLTSGNGFAATACYNFPLLYTTPWRYTKLGQFRVDSWQKNLEHIPLSKERFPRCRVSSTYIHSKSSGFKSLTDFPNILLRRFICFYGRIFHLEPLIFANT